MKNLPLIAKNLAASFIAIVIAQSVYASPVIELPIEQNDLWVEGETRLLSEAELDTLFLTEGDTKPSYIGRGMNYISEIPQTRSCYVPSTVAVSTRPSLKKNYQSRALSNIEDLTTVITDVIHEPNAFSTFESYKNKILKHYQDQGNPPIVLYRLAKTKNEYMMSSWPELNPNAVKWLKSGNSNGKINFRNACGDGYIDRLIVGDVIHVLVAVMSETKTFAERELVARNLTGAMAEGQSALEQYEAAHPDYTFVVNAYIQGQESGGDDWTIYNLKERLSAFETRDAADSPTLAYMTSYYTNPVEDDFWHVFVDYRNALSHKSQWGSFMRWTFTPRCPAEDDTEKNNFCELTSDSYNLIRGQCADIKTWEQCVEPNDPACTLADGSYCNILKNYEPEPVVCKGNCDEDSKSEASDENSEAKISITSNAQEGGSFGFFSLFVPLLVLLFRRRNYT